MNARFQVKQHSDVVQVIFGVALALLWCGPASAQQISPNPNPVGDTIVVTGANTNDENFDNEGIILIELVGTLDNSGILANLGVLYNYGTLDNSSWLQNFNYLENSGTLDNSGILANSGWLENSGTLTSSLGLWNQGTGTLENSGTLTSSYLLWNEGTLTNSGTLDNSGTLINTSGIFNNDGGTYKGTGTFIGTLDTGTGTVAPGSSAGTMFVDGDYILDGTGTLEIEIGGFDPGEFDLLDITGTAYLTGGTIDLMFTGDYDIITDIGYGETWSLMFLEADLGINSFASSITYDFLGTPDGFLYNVYRDGTGLWFQAANTNVNPVPVPGAVILGSMGLAVAGWRLRKRRTL